VGRHPHRAGAEEVPEVRTGREQREHGDHHREPAQQRAGVAAHDREVDHPADGDRNRGLGELVQRHQERRETQLAGPGARPAPQHCTNRHRPWASRDRLHL
jgi:hypothetical protein